MRRDQLSPADLTAAVSSAAYNVSAAKACAVRVVVDGNETGAAVTRVTVNALGVTLWAET